MILTLIYVAAGIFGIALVLLLYGLMKAIKEKKNEQIPE